ncbi:MAG TPA: TAXI family TRAP transporter solute-binding subunit [Beijerinckiaceae bacterium]|nr:TAXI family TRAP transporter solute-binding subunit [Beijerinckiaceae bacterium]
MSLRFLMRREWLLAALALALALALGVFFYFSQPALVRVAVAPPAGEEARLLRAYANSLRTERKDLRLEIIPFDTLGDSARALEGGRVDVAVVRPDVYLPVNGLTVAILREEAAIIVAPTTAKITEVADLGKKRLGVVTLHEADTDFVAKVLGHYDLAPPEVTLVPIALEAVEAALKDKRIDAIAAVAAPTSAAATALVRAVERTADRKITVVPVSEADALAERFPAVTPITLPAGALGGRPKQPDEEAKTVGASYRLMARSELGRNVVGSFAQYLFQMRSRLAADAPSANLMKAPNTDLATSATLPIHPGAVDYFNREQLTFMERHGDWVWLAVLSAGSVGSGLAWLAQLFARRRRELVDSLLDRLLRILEEARRATNASELDALSLEIDRLVSLAVRHARRRATGTRTMGALILAIDSARAAVAEKRRDLTGEEAAAPAPRPFGARRFASGEV